jgi:beta-phosphoglucomutase
MNNEKQLGVIFDLDGVIVDTAKHHFVAWQQLAQSQGWSFTTQDNEQLKGVSRVRSLELILEWNKAQISTEVFDRLLIEKNERYLSLIADMDASERLPDVQRVLQTFKKHGCKIALGSASKNARPILDKIELTPYFDVIVDGTNVSKAKPDPEVFLQAANQLGIAPKDCVVFEDAVAGIQAAKAAGMRAFGIGAPELLTQADRVFNDFTQLDDPFIEHNIIGK